MKIVRTNKTASVIMVLFFIVLQIQSQDPAAAEEAPVAPAFILELKVAINDKFYNPKNISLSLNQNSTAGYTFNLSSVNFNKNVSVVTKLFAWYNNDWVARQSQTLKITDQQTNYRLKNHLLLKLLKFNSRKYERELYEQKSACLLQNVSLLVSYDPQSSLLVSRLEDPSLFIDSQQCVFIPKGDKSASALPVKIIFKAIERTDLFIEFKNHIVELNQVSAKLKKEKLVLSSKPVPQDMSEPLHLWRLIVQNVKALQTQIKKVNQKIDVISKKNYKGLIAPEIHTINFQQDFQTVFKIAKSNNIANITLVDALLPAYQFTYHQTDFLDRIGYLQKAIRRYLFAVNIDWVKIAEKYAQIGYWGSLIIGAFWILLDIIAYKNIDKHLGISQSFGFFLNTWIFLQIIHRSLWISSLVGQLAGFICFLLLLILHYVLINKMQKLFISKKHSFSSLDQVITKCMFNTLIMAIIASIYLHIWDIRDLRNYQLLLWTFSQLEELLAQYYYCLILIPQIIVNWRLKNASPISIARLLLLYLIAFRDNYWLIIDGVCHWSLILFYLKEEILWLFIVLQKLIYNKSGNVVQIEDIQRQKQSTDQQPHQSSELKEKQQ